MAITKKQVEARLELTELVAEIYKKVFNEPVLKVVALYQKHKSCDEKELEGYVGRDSMERALSVGIIRKVVSRYELTDLGMRISEHAHEVLTDIHSAETPLPGMSEQHFWEYKALAMKYHSFLQQLNKV